MLNLGLNKLGFGINKEWIAKKTPYKLNICSVYRSFCFRKGKNFGRVFSVSKHRGGLSISDLSFVICHWRGNPMDSYSMYIIQHIIQIEQKIFEQKKQII